MSAIAVFSSLVVAATACGLLVAVWLTDWRCRRRDRKAAAAKTWADPLVYGAIAHPELAEVVVAIDGKGAELLESRLTEIATKVRGADRDNIISILEQRQVIDRSTAMLSSRRAAKRRDAVERLGRLRVEAAAPHLHELVDDPSPAVRSAVIAALGRIGTEQALTSIMTGAMRGDLANRNEVILGLFRLGHRALPQARMLAASPVRNAQIIGLSLMGLNGDHQRLDLLHAGLWSSDQTIAAAAIDALSRVAAADSTEDLLLYVDHGQHREVRALAAAILERTGDEETVAQLNRSLMREAAAAPSTSGTPADGRDAAAPEPEVALVPAVRNWPVMACGARYA